MSRRSGVTGLGVHGACCEKVLSPSESTRIPTDHKWKPSLSRVSPEGCEQKVSQTKGLGHILGSLTRERWSAHRWGMGLMPRVKMVDVDSIENIWWLRSLEARKPLELCHADFLTAINESKWLQVIRGTDHLVDGQWSLRRPGQTSKQHETTTTSVVWSPLFSEPTWG